MTRLPTKRRIAATLALSLGLALAACGGMPTNRSLESVKQPVVSRTNYTFDVNNGPGGLQISEQRRLAGWFEAMDLRYGDRVAIEDPLMSPATRETVAALAGRYGLLLSDVAPVTTGYVDPGMARVVVTRSTASVPGCPDWSARSDANYANATYPGYGCAVNSNIAAMVADPEHLLNGAEGTGETTVMSSTKAIDAYRKQAPSGQGGLGGGGSGGGASGGGN